MRRALALAAVTAGFAATLLPVQSASACDPNRFPNCMTYCEAIAWRYEQLRGDQNLLDLPAWPRTGVAGCP